MAPFTILMGPLYVIDEDSGQVTQSNGPYMEQHVSLERTCEFQAGLATMAAERAKLSAERHKDDAETPKPIRKP